MDILALLFPREKKFYQMIEEQVSLVSEAIDDYHSLISKFEKYNKKERQKLILNISRKEKYDDILYTKMVQALKSTFITPIDREDLHQLVATFDTIIDTLELLSLKLNAFEIRKIDKYIKEQSRILEKEFKLIEKMILSLRRESEAEKYCREIRALEQEGDKIFINALHELFADSVGAKDIIKLNDIYSSMESMIDEVNEASLIIENIVVKYS